MRAGNNVFIRFFTPQHVFIIERQEGDIGAGKHGVVGGLRLFFAGPQTRTVVVVENDLTAACTAGFQQGHQAVAAWVIEDRQADAAQIEIIEFRQCLTNLFRLRAVQPVTRCGVVAPVVESALAGVIRLNHVQARQFVFQTLGQIGMNPFLLPRLQHLTTETVIAQRRHVMHVQRIRRYLAGDIHRRIQRIATKTTMKGIAFL